jgi:hypothetical protein
MAFRTRFTRTILSTSFVVAGLFVGLQPASASASVLTAGLEAYADEFGDSNGHIVTQSVGGPTLYLAHLVRGFYMIYTAGNSVADDATLAMCQQSPFGGLTNCQVVNPPSPTGYECDWDENDSWCTCEGLLDCVDMFKNGPCDEDVSCDGSGCTCAA